MVSLVPPQYVAPVLIGTLVVAHEPLRVSLEDLHSAESKGKWWLVGAAWHGDPLVDRQDSHANVSTNQAQDTANELSNNALLKLARKQGMNTDIRRSIFVVLMSSDVCLSPSSIFFRADNCAGLRRCLRATVAAQPDRIPTARDN